MNIFKIKKKDTAPALSVTLEYANGTPIDLTGGSVWFNMGNSDYTPYTSGPCVISSAVSGIVEYRWTDLIDTGSVGTYYGEFEMQNLTLGSRATLPVDHSLKIQVFEDYN